MFEGGNAVAPNGRGTSDPIRFSGGRVQRGRIMTRDRISGRPVDGRAIRLAEAQAQAKGLSVRANLCNRDATAWAGASIAPAKGQAGAARFVTGQIGQVQRAEAFAMAKYALGNS